jgi:hypothetical protein
MLSPQNTSVATVDFGGGSPVDGIVFEMTYVGRIQSPRITSSARNVQWYVRLVVPRRSIRIKGHVEMTRFI